MDCDEIETEATKTIGSTDIDKVFKKLKNKHTKESIILLDYIEKLEDELNNRIPKEKVNEIIDDYENQLTEKNNYIFDLESEREALWNKLDEEFE